MPEHGGDAQQPRHNPGGTHRRPAAVPVQLPQVGNHSLERLLTFFCFHERVFAGQIWHWMAKLVSAVWVWDLLCKRDVTLGWDAPAGSCYVAGVSTRFVQPLLLIPAATSLFL